MKFSLWNVCRVGLVSSVLTLMACTGGGGRGVGGTGLVISGQLGGSSSMALSKMSLKSSDMSAFADGFDDLEIVATAATEPPTTATGSVDAQGNFSVDLGSGAAGTAITVTFVDENTEAVVAEVKFTDSSKTDLNGNPKSDSAVVATGSMDLGSIVLAEDGTVEVPKGSVAAIQQDTPVAAASAFNPTGEWTMDAYEKVGASFTVGAQDPDDPGMPHIGFKLSLARFDGKEFTPNSGSCVKDASGTMTSCPVTSGTVGTADRYALSIWGGDYANSIGACGGNTGFSADEARGHGRIHITTLPTVRAASGAMNFGPYVWSTTSDWGGMGAAPYDQPWMTTSGTLAKAQHEEADCRPMLVSGTTKIYNAWACKSKVYTGAWPGSPVSAGTIAWHVGIQGGGCFNDATQKPVNVTNWNTIGNAAQCDDNVATQYGTGFRENECHYTNVDPDGSGPMGNINMTCKHIGGQFTDAGGNPSSTQYTPGSGEYLGRPETILAQDAACSSAGSGSNAAILAGYRCYANAYWRARDQASGGGCEREYRFNWQAVNPWEFVSRDDFKGRPKNAFITNILNYAADGKSATLEDEETESMTVPTSANGSTFCRVVRKTLLSFKSITATKMLVELKESGRMASTDAACVAAANAALTSSQETELKYTLTPMTLYFYLNKL
ncbi:hypothetical protein [Pseudobdellovibrio sp. HCB154]|uniref:hypothetical protein n=1 Tax=Pseudobdellovibrio sp. HCB154 TaxID=3386277 RepID=UPI0039174C1F